MSVISEKYPPRSQWGRLFSVLPSKQVIVLAEALCAVGGWQVDPVLRDGLRLLPLRESTRGESFYLGEVSVVEVRVMLQNDAGKMLEGGVALLGVSVELAEAAAVLDAFLAADLDPEGKIADLLAEGKKVLQAIEAERAHMCSRTRVDFSLLSDADEEDAV